MSYKIQVKQVLLIWDAIIYFFFILTLFFFHFLSQHNYCKSCWETYLTTKINEGDASHILCPAFGVSNLS